MAVVGLRFSRVEYKWYFLGLCLVVLVFTLALWIRSVFGIFAMPSQCRVLVVGLFFWIMGGLWHEEQVPGDVGGCQGVFRVMTGVTGIRQA